jgi:hypothetical protein
MPAPGMGADKGMLLHAALAQLDGRQAAILRLHDHDGYSNSDIAKMYGMKEAAVRQIVSRGRAEVRPLLGDSNSSLTGQKGGKQGNEHEGKEDQGLSRFRENAGCGSDQGAGSSTDRYDEQFGVYQPAGCAGTADKCWFVSIQSLVPSAMSCIMVWSEMAERRLQHGRRCCWPAIGFCRPRFRPFLRLRPGGLALRA